MTKLLGSCLCLFDAIIELHPLDAKTIQCLSQWKVNMDFKCNKGKSNS